MPRSWTGVLWWVRNAWAAQSWHRRVQLSKLLVLSCFHSSFCIIITLRAVGWRRTYIPVLEKRVVFLGFNDGPLSDKRWSLYVQNQVLMVSHSLGLSWWHEGYFYPASIPICVYDVICAVYVDKVHHRLLEWKFRVHGDTNGSHGWDSAIMSQIRHWALVC